MDRSSGRAPSHESGRQIAIDAFTAWLATQLALVPAAAWWQLAGMLVALRASTRLGMWPYALLALPGTLAHELSHYTVALALGASPAFPSLLPERSERGWRLGSVSFRAGLLRSLPIVLAPLVLLPLALAWAIAFLPTASWPLRLLHLWLVAALAYASLPSRADLRIALPALTIVALAGLAVFLLGR
jgi:hypothetical protein